MSSTLVAFLGVCCFLPDHARAVPYFNWLPGGGPSLPVSLGEVASAIVDRKMFVFGQGNFGTFVYARLPFQRRCVSSSDTIGHPIALPTHRV